MICLTGDIHHMSLKTNDQKYLQMTETEAALEYAAIAKEFNIRVTFFATGKAVVEEKANFKKLIQYPNLELAGHTYYAFRPKWLYSGAFKIINGSANGPAVYQNYEIKKTKKVFKKILNSEIISWRDHAYKYNQDTYRLLAQNNIKFVSDEVTPNKIRPYPTNDNLISVPINIMPDHDHLYHADLTPATTQNWRLFKDKFPAKLYYPDKWLNIIKTQISQVIQKKGVATILVHPACMKIADNFQTLKQLCRFIANHYPTGLIKDLKKQKVK